MSERFKTQPVRLGSILRKIQKKRIKIPVFQRSFIWEERHIKDLLLTLLKGCPAGTLLFWKTGDRKTTLESSPVEGVSANDAGKVENLILDGQQRLTSLYHLFFLPSVKVKKSAQKTVDKGFFFNVEKLYKELGVSSPKRMIQAVSNLDENNRDEIIYVSEHNETQALISSPNEQYSKHLLPIQASFDETKIRKWIEGYVSHWKQEKQKSEKWKNREVDKMLQLLSEEDGSVFKNIRDYEFPVVEISGDLNEVTYVFEKINTAGKVLSLFDILNAKFYSKRFHLSREWKNATESNLILRDFDNKYHVLAIYMLRSILLINEQPCKRKDLMETLTISDLKNQWDEIVKRLNYALNKLRDSFGAPSSEFMPYPSMIPPFLALSKLIEEHRMDDKKLTTWYWSSVFSHRYESSTDSNAYTDVSEFRKWSEDPERIPEAVKNFVIEEGGEIELNFKSPQFFAIEKTRNATALGILNLIAANDAEDFIDSDKVMTLLKVGKKNIHEIFPQKWCEEKNIKDSVLSVVNKTILKDSSNRKIRDKSPKEYVDVLKVSEEKLKKHFISVDLLKANKYREFLKKRENDLKKHIEKLVVGGMPN